MTEADIDAVVLDTLSEIYDLVDRDTYEEMKRILFVTAASHPVARNLMEDLHHASGPAPTTSEEVARMEQEDVLRLTAILKAVG